MKTFKEFLNEHQTEINEDMSSELKSVAKLLMQALNDAEARDKDSIKLDVSGNNLIVHTSTIQNIVARLLRH